MSSVVVSCVCVFVCVAAGFVVEGEGFGPDGRHFAQLCAALLIAFECC